MISIIIESRQIHVQMSISKPAPYENPTEEVLVVLQGLKSVGSAKRNQHGSSLQKLIYLVLFFDLIFR